LLHLEDLDDMAIAMKKDLMGLGFADSSITRATNVTDALRLLQTTKFNLIITDWNLPDGNGGMLIERARSLLFYKNVPILVCSTVDDVGNLLNAIKLGANEYLVKPWDATLLNQKLSYLLPMSLRVLI